MPKVTLKQSQPLLNQLPPLSQPRQKVKKYNQNILTNTDVKPAGDKQATDAGKPKKDSDEGGECTKNHCYYCDTDGKKRWCTRCGNGKVINQLSGKGRKCTKDLKIKNCRSAPLNDALNVNACGECQRGYYFDKKTNKCVGILGKIPGCTRPIFENGQILCAGCEGKFLTNDRKACSKNEKLREEAFPAHCTFGGTEEKKTCLECGHGWRPSQSGRSCEEEIVTGCDIYHPNEPQKCLTCNSEHGFYAVKAKKNDADVYQKCKFEGNALYIGFAALATLAFSWMN